MNILCKLFGHAMYFEGNDVSNPSICKRCGHTEPGVNWPRTTPSMPKVKPPTESDAGAQSLRETALKVLELQARITELEYVLALCRETIEPLGEDALGSGTDGQRVWSLREELLYKIACVLPN